MNGEKARNADTPLPRRRAATPETMALLHRPDLNILPLGGKRAMRAGADVDAGPLPRLCGSHYFGTRPTKYTTDSGEVKLGEDFTRFASATAVLTPLRTHKTAKSYGAMDCQGPACPWRMATAGSACNASGNRSAMRIGRGRGDPATWNPAARQPQKTCLLPFTAARRGREGRAGREGRRRQGRCRRRNRTPRATRRRNRTP